MSLYATSEWSLEPRKANERYLTLVWQQTHGGVFCGVTDVLLHFIVVPYIHSQNLKHARMACLGKKISTVWHFWSRITIQCSNFHPWYRQKPIKYLSVLPASNKNTYLAWYFDKISTSKVWYHAYDANTPPPPNITNFIIRSGAIWKILDRKNSPNMPAWHVPDFHSASIYLH